MYANWLREDTNFSDFTFIEHQVRSFNLV